MNTEANQDTTKLSTGERLRTAREAKGMTQQNVADRLCLKLSTVRDIEDDKSPAELAATFLRGYIRSYARLVHIPEAELLPDLKQQVPVSPAKVTPMQSYAITSRRSRKKRDGLLTTFTWLIVFIVVGLTVAWWWQNHKAAQTELTSNLSTQQNSESGDSQSIPLSANQADPSSQQAMQSENQPVDETTSTEPAVQAPTATATPAPVPSGTSPSVAPDSAPAVSTSAPTLNTTPATTQSEAAAQTNADALTVQFSADCWLEISDATGKKLFSGLQHTGASLNLNGKLPYRLKIGAPSAVSIQFRGQPVDLSRFVQRNQVARLSVGKP